MEATNVAINQTCTKIKALVLLLDSLRSHRGSFSVATFPPEVLPHIFKYCTDVDYLDHTPKARKNWLAFSQVCTGWRHVAISCPSLWTMPDLSKPDLAKMMVERARPLPLEITAREMSELASPLALGVKLHLEKLCYLHPRGRPWNDAGNRLSEYLSGHFPHLKRLYLSGIVDHSSGIVPIDLGNLKAPLLQDICLPNSVLRRISTSSMTSLTSVTLTYDIDVSEHGGIGPLVGIFDILTPLSRLESLLLTDATRLGPYRSLEAGNLPCITLPALKSLTLQDHASNLLPLLRQLNMPKLHKVAIHVVPVAAKDILDDLEKLYCSVRRLIHDAAWPTSSHSTLDVITSPRHIVLERATPQYSLHVGIVNPPGPGFDVKNFILRFLSSLPLGLVYSVCCRAKTDVFTDYWMVLAKLPCVHRIAFQGVDSVTSKSFQRLLDALLSSSSAFPALQILELYGMTTFELVHYDLTRWLLRSLLLSLECIANTRAAMHNTSLSITLSHCTFAAAGFAGLPSYIHVESPRILHMPGLFQPGASLPSNSARCDMIVQLRWQYGNC